MKRRTRTFRPNYLSFAGTSQCKRMNVVGVLTVIDHEAATVNGVIVPAWAELRASE